MQLTIHTHSCTNWVSKVSTEHKSYIALRMHYEVERRRTKWADIVEEASVWKALLTIDRTVDESVWSHQS